MFEKHMAKKLKEILSEQVSIEERYLHFVEELKAILTEGVYDANSRMIETYHMFGLRIVEETKDLAREDIYGKKITEKIAKDIGKSQRTIQKCVQFARDYPDLDKFLAEVQEGKNITWNKVSNHYLVTKKEKSENPPLIEDAPNYSDDNIKKALLANVDFLVDNVQITDQGMNFFLPIDRY